MSEPDVAVVFLARGYEQDCYGRFQRFIRAYKTFSAGCPHNLHVIFKGFRTAEAEVDARAVFSVVPHVAHGMEDVGFDIGAYRSVLNNLDEQYVCFLNSNSEILAENWLQKFILNLSDPMVGIVGATGSYESLNFLYPDFPSFPNIHLRTNGIALRTSHARRFFPKDVIFDKVDAWRFESGRNSLTQQLFFNGLTCLVVGRNGRGYEPTSWPQSETYRQGSQANLMISDNVTRLYQGMTPNERRVAIQRTWGEAFPPKLFRSMI